MRTYTEQFPPTNQFRIHRYVTGKDMNDAFAMLVEVRGLLTISRLVS